MQVFETDLSVTILHKEQLFKQKSALGYPSIEYIILGKLNDTGAILVVSFSLPHRPGKVKTHKLISGSQRLLLLMTALLQVFLTFLKSPQLTKNASENNTYCT